MADKEMVEWVRKCKPEQEPRRTQGAVVLWADIEYIVLDSGAEGLQRRVAEPSWVDAVPDKDDKFVRWATREECERHGIPYVERAAAGLPPLPSDRVAELEAEVEALRAEVDNVRGTLLVAQSQRENAMRERDNERTRAERAEAEVARLRDELGIAKRNADYFEREYVDLLHRYTKPTPAAPGLDALRARFIDACAEICVAGSATPFDARRYDLADKEYEEAAAEIVAAKAAIAQRAAAKEVK